MPAPKYIHQLPTDGASVASFFFVNYNLIAPKVEAIAHGLTLPQIRQLLALQMLIIQRRKLYIGSCQWLRNSPSNGSGYIKKKVEFYINIEVLHTLNYIEVVQVPRGKVARLTLKGELLTTQINTFLTDYYKRIFAQFNLKAVI
jgi:hypothetical protein